MTSSFRPGNNGPALADVILLSPPYGTLTYALPDRLPLDAWAVGMRVAAPLGRGCRSAIIVALRREGEGPPPPAGLRELVWPLERRPMFGAGYLDVIRHLALRQAVPSGRILGTVVPSSLRDPKTRIRFHGNGLARDVPASGMDSVDRADLALFANIWMRGEALCLGSVDDPLDNEVCVLAQDPPWPVRPRAMRQTEVLEYLYAHGSDSRRRLATDLGPQGMAALAILAERGLVRILAAEQRPEEEPTGGGSAAWQASFTLTAAQRQVLEALVVPVRAGRAETHLVHGITGSGKTAVFLSLAAECLSAGKSVMLLAPEVGLAIKLHNEAREQLPDAAVLLYHGYQTARQRDQAFRSVAGEGGPRLIVGTRSALFLPVASLGAVILDEEHDASFKQDEGLSYQAKELAWFRAARENALLVLGSATPDVKTFHAAREGTVALHSLPERVGGGALPAIRLVSMPRKGGAGSGLESALAPESLEALAACVDRGDQAIILLNRRGYAPLMYCLTCAQTLTCPQCSISLTYHKARERAVCHYCGHAQPYPTPCPSCGGLHFLPMGEGTEKLEENLLPGVRQGTRILRLDRDSTRRPGSLESILNAFARREAQVLVGTQMLSKGHHFPDVTLVIAADADLGLNLPDYRATERTFQLLVQAAGRAGRAEKPGEVLIQTRDPDHYCWEYVVNGDYRGFYDKEIAKREQRRYPPFVRLALLRFSFPADNGQGQQVLEDAAKAVKDKARRDGVTVLGPAPAPIALLRGMKRFHCLIKGQTWNQARELYAVAQARVGRKGGMRLALDLDPLNML